METITLTNCSGQICVVPVKNISHFTTPDNCNDLKIVLKDGSEIHSFESLKDFMERIKDKKSFEISYEELKKRYSYAVEALNIIAHASKEDTDANFYAKAGLSNALGYNVFRNSKQ